MAEPIGPGDIVEFWRRVEDDHPGWGEGPALVLGAIYTVEWVWGPSDFDDGIGALVLKEVPGFYPDEPGFVSRQRYCYDVRCFRPIYRPKSSLIEGLLQPLDEKVDA